jgi:hypothetical protein
MGAPYPGRIAEFYSQLWRPRAQNAIELVIPAALNSGAGQAGIQLLLFFDLK